MCSCPGQDLTHYFVMTATKDSLLARKVLLSNHEDRTSLLSPSNIDRTQLALYAKEACLYATGNSWPVRPLPLSRLLLQETATHNLRYQQQVSGPKSCRLLIFILRGDPDLSIFDFTNLYAARNSCRCLPPPSLLPPAVPRAVVRKGFPLLLAVAGDSLLEPFWPDGTGCARGFISALDAGWMVGQETGAQKPSSNYVLICLISGSFFHRPRSVLGPCRATPWVCWRRGRGCTTYSARQQTKT